MALIPIVKYPDPRLKEKSAPVVAFDDTLQRFIRDMSDTMYAAPGVGLAAIQVGNPIRVFVMDSREEENPTGLEVFVNPEIVEGNGQVVFEEGCLSLPGFTEEVKRFERISVRYQTEQGETQEKAIDGFRAVIFQHELDHLDGILALDRISRLKKTFYNRRRERELKEEKDKKEKK